MSVDELWQLIRNGRSSQVDWFGEQTPMLSLAETLSAMANHHGGHVFLGISGGQTASVVGVRNPSESVDFLLQAALSIEPPLIVPLPGVVKLNGKSLVVLQIPSGMPHVYSIDGRYLQRQQAENIPLKPTELRHLLMERGEASFETEIARAASLNDIDWEKAKTYVNTLNGMGDNVEQVLLKRACLAEHEGHLRPTNAGILLFGKDTQRFIRGADITAARFASEIMSDRFSRQDITGTLPDQIKRAEVFLIDHLRKDIQLGQTMAREENFEYPMEAARELVVNAVAHRDYRISGDGIRLFVFSNRMEVTSPGGLPGPVTTENIKDERFSRNPAIVQVLSDMGFIERLGYGVDRVIDLMLEKKLQAPEFEDRTGTFRVTLRNENLKPDDKSEVPGPTIEFGGSYRGESINPRQEAALTHLHREGHTRITNSDLQTLCPDVHPETIRRDLADLVNKNILRKMGEKRGSYYVLNNKDG